MKSRTMMSHDDQPFPQPAGDLETITASDLNDLRDAIAVAAYYRAEKRGFEPGHEWLDWLEAEQEVAACVQGPDA